MLHNNIYSYSWRSFLYQNCHFNILSSSSFPIFTESPFHLGSPFLCFFQNGIFIDTPTK